MEGNKATMNQSLWQIHNTREKHLVLAKEEVSETGETGKGGGGERKAGEESKALNFMAQL
jgi:hypothetical protein